VTARKPRVYEQSGTTFVIGTDDIYQALASVGISPETHRWGGTGFGLYVRRQGLWRGASEYQPPKDAKPGIAFFGLIQAKEIAP
jgi:hypothetical protein